MSVSNYQPRYADDAERESRFLRKQEVVCPKVDHVETHVVAGTVHLQPDLVRVLQVDLLAREQVDQDGRVDVKSGLDPWRGDVHVVPLLNTVDDDARQLKLHLMQRLALKEKKHHGSHTHTNTHTRICLHTYKREKNGISTLEWVP